MPVLVACGQAHEIDRLGGRRAAWFFNHSKTLLSYLHATNEPNGCPVLLSTQANI